MHGAKIYLKNVKNWKQQLYTKEGIIHKTIQNHRIHKIEKKHTRQENKQKKSIKKT